MGVRAKMFVTETTRTPHGGKVKLSAVCRGEDNKAWAAATPNGMVELTILSDVALVEFEPGVEYFVDFTRVPHQGTEGMDDGGTGA